MPKNRIFYLNLPVLRKPILLLCVPDSLDLREIGKGHVAVVDACLGALDGKQLFGDAACHHIAALLVAPDEEDQVLARAVAGEDVPAAQRAADTLPKRLGTALELFPVHEGLALVVRQGAEQQVDRVAEALHVPLKHPVDVDKAWERREVGAGIGVLLER